MPNTDKAGTSLPQNCPELEQFIKAQAHIRAAARILDSLNVHPLPLLPDKKRDFFHHIAEGAMGKLYESLDEVENLQFMFFSPFYTLNTDKDGI